VVSLGSLSESDVEVQLVHGLVGQNDELFDTETVTMAKEGPADDGNLRFAGSFTTEKPGRHGLTVRVVPAHPDLASPTELGVIAWA
jgi:starch phosphorylase